MRSLMRLPQLLVALVAASIVVALVPALPAEARGPIEVVSREVATSIARQRVVQLPIVASHVAVHWLGDHDAALTVAFSADGLTFDAARAVEHDESDGHDGHGRTYSGVIWTDGARFVRIQSDRPIPQLSVVAIDSRGESARTMVPQALTRAAVEAPAISSRAQWRADESLRYDSAGNEIWPPEFQTLQKLIVHHTAGKNNDPDPESTVRAIYHYHAVTRGWGDIGYNFLIDEGGRIYEGRYSRAYAAGETPSGEDLQGGSVTAAHVGGYNSGTLGVALLGTLTTSDATPAARASLEWLLAWKAERHGIDPLGSSLYVNPVNGYQKTTGNISAHRDWAATECPGDKFYASLPALRQAVANRLSGTSVTVPGAPVLSAAPAPKRGVRLDWTAPADGGSPIQEYRVLRWKSDRYERIATVSGSQLWYRDTSTRKGRTYRYVVRAVNSVGVGPFSNEASAVAR